MQLHWLFLSLYNQQQSGCDRMSFTHSVAAFFAFLWHIGALSDKASLASEYQVSRLLQSLV